jgi:hypothetical protein
MHISPTRSNLSNEIEHGEHEIEALTLAELLPSLSPSADYDEYEGRKLGGQARLIGGKAHLFAPLSPNMLKS